MDRPWTVVTWNVHGRERPRTRLPAAALRGFEADVIALQEVRWWQARRIGRLLGMRVDWRLKHFPFTRAVFPFAEGAAILTPHEIRGATSVEISSGQPISTYRRRIAQSAIVRRPAGDALHVFNVHLSPESLRDDRRAEADELRRLVAAAAPIGRSVIAGDLNDADEPEIIDMLPLVEHDRPEPTNPTENPHQVLDHVLLPADAVHERTVVPTTEPIWAEISDHLPVIVTFRIGGVERRAAG